MSIAFRDVSSMASGTTSLTLTTPATVQNGDVLVCFIGDRATSGSTAAPSGWTRQNIGGTGASGRIQIFTAVVGTGGVTANQATTFSGFTTACIGGMTAYSGVDPSVVVDVAAPCRSNASGTTGTSPATTVSNNVWVALGFISFASGSTWSGGKCATNPTSCTDRLNVANGTTNSIYITDGPRNPITSGTTGASSATMGTPGTNGGGIAALRPLTSWLGNTVDGVTAGDTESGVVTHAASTVTPQPAVAGWISRYEDRYRKEREEQQLQRNVVFVAPSLRAQFRLGAVRVIRGRGITAHVSGLKMRAMLFGTAGSGSVAPMALTLEQLNMLLGRGEAYAETHAMPFVPEMVARVGRVKVKGIRNLSDEDLIQFLDEIA
jgi:hypothetical protein